MLDKLAMSVLAESLAIATFFRNFLGISSPVILTSACIHQFALGWDGRLIFSHTQNQCVLLEVLHYAASEH